MKLFGNTLEHKRALIFENILELLSKGFKIIVLNKKRRVEIKQNKEQYIKNKIEKTLKSKKKQAVFQIIQG